MKRLALILALSGCAADAIPVRIVNAEDHDSLVAGAEDLLGVPIEPTDRQYGTINVAIVGRHNGHAGMVFLSWPCVRAATSVEAPNSLAHEIGHALGLEHHGDPNNTMHRKSGLGGLNDAQRMQLLRGLERLQSCR